jgi:hypothetical protein
MNNKEVWYGDMKGVHESLDKVARQEIKLEVWENDLDKKKNDCQRDQVLTEARLDKLTKKFAEVEQKKKVEKNERLDALAAHGISKNSMLPIK